MLKLMKTTISFFGISPPKLWDSSEHGGLQRENYSYNTESTHSPLKKHLSPLNLQQKHWRESDSCEASTLLANNLCTWCYPQEGPLEAYPRLGDLQNSSDIKNLAHKMWHWSFCNFGSSITSTCSRIRTKGQSFCIFRVFLRLKRKELLFGFSDFTSL